MGSGASSQLVRYRVPLGKISAYPRGTNSENVYARIDIVTPFDPVQGTFVARFGGNVHIPNRLSTC